ncbi:MAG: hypothetical protein PHU14_08140 [Methylovulum sp.]|nr:hypothetical protein [Methylovulum sp.]
MLKLLLLIGSFFGSIVGYAAASLGRKAIVVAAVVTAFLAVTVAFLVCINLIIASIVSVIAVPAWLTAFFGMFVPSNYSGVLSLILSAKTCRAAYDLAIAKVKMIGNSN